MSLTSFCGGDLKKLDEKLIQSQNVFNDDYTSFYFLALLQTWNL